MQYRRSSSIIAFSIVIIVVLLLALTGTDIDIAFAERNVSRNLDAGESATPTSTPPPTAGTLTCYSDSSIFDCVQIDPYTVRWNIIGNPYNKSSITGQFQVQYPNNLVYVLAHWDAPLWVSTFGVNTNPKGRYGITGLPSTYINDGGYGSVCAHNPNQLCGNYPLGDFLFTQPAVTNSSGRATVGFQQTANPATTVFWTPYNAYIIVSSLGYGGPTSTPTNTPTATFTPTLTYTPTNTFTPTATASFTPTVTLTPTTQVRWYTGNSQQSAYGVKADISAPTSRPYFENLDESGESNYVTIVGPYWVQTGWHYIYNWIWPWSYVETYNPIDAWHMEDKSIHNWGQTKEYQVVWDNNSSTWCAWIDGIEQECYDVQRSAPTTVRAHSEVHVSPLNGLNTNFTDVFYLDSNNNWQLFNQALWMEDSPYQVDKYQYYEYQNYGP